MKTKQKMVSNILSMPKVDELEKLVKTIQSIVVSHEEWIDDFARRIVRIEQQMIERKPTCNVGPNCPSCYPKREARIQRFVWDENTKYALFDDGTWKELPL